MKKFSEAVLAKHKHMAMTASPHHPHSQGLVYTPKGKEEVRPIDTADAGYGGESVSDAEGGEADAGKASKKAVSPMKMPTLVKPGLDKANEETERERLQKLRSFAWKSSRAGLGSDYHQALGGSEVYRKDLGGVKRAVMEDEQIDELKKSTLASYAKKATDDVSYHSFTAGTMSSKDPERLAQDKKAMKRQTGVIKAIDRLAKEEVEQVDEAEYVPTQRSNFIGKRHLKRDHSDELGSRYVFSTDPAKMKKSYSTEKGQKNAANRNVANLKATIKSSLGKHSKPNLPEEVEQVDEGSKRMSAAVKLQRAFDRDKVSSDASRKRGEERLAQARAEYAKKQAAKTNEEVELDERNMENKAKKDNVVRQVGTHAYIKHGADAGSSYFSSKMTGRKVMSDPKFKSSKIADMYRKLPSMEEATGVTNYNPKSQGGTRVELLQKLAKSKSPEHATAARKAGATQSELKAAMMREENDGTEADAGEYGYEGDMAMTQLKSIIRNAKELHDHMEPQTDLPEWVQSKITLAADYIQTAADYWKSEKEEAMSEGKAEDEKAARAADVLGGPVKPKSSVIGGPGQPKSARNLAMRLATKAMKAGRSVSEEKKSKVPRIGEMEKALEEEVWDKPMPDSKKQGSLSAEQKAKAKARADRAGRSYPNMIDNMWASKQ